MPNRSSPQSAAPLARFAIVAPTPCLQIVYIEPGAQLPWDVAALAPPQGLTAQRDRDGNWRAACFLGRLE
jgi:hypothetical protein